jgi:hypothetical protein
MRKGEGCNLNGFMSVNKVAGNFHIAFGDSVVKVRVLPPSLPSSILLLLLWLTPSFPPSLPPSLPPSFSQDGRHIHQFIPSEAPFFNVSHSISHISFGDEYPGRINPLDGKVKVGKEGGIGGRMEILELHGHRPSLFTSFLPSLPPSPSLPP